jgi:glucose-1-phosphate adenylyltransferase
MNELLQRKKILALVLAGGVGGRLGLLTEKRAKPVMPFAGNYRLIDFALSNCLHSGISDVWVVEQYELHTLNEHLANGRPWDLDRTFGGLQVLPPFEDRKKSSAEGGFAHGNADAIFRHQKLIAEFNPDILISLSADHIYKFDFRDAIETHLKNRASVTIVTTKLPSGETASRFGVVKANKNGRVTDFAYKPDKPESDIVTTEIFVYDAPVMLKTLKVLNEEKGEIKDYGDELIPHLVETGKAFEHRHTGYWRDVGTIESYWKSQMDLLDGKTKLKIDDENWRILTRAESNVPAFIYDSGKITNSWIADGTKIYGAVKKSILSAGVTVEKGAEIEECVVLPGAVVEKGVKLKRAIIDADTRVSPEKLKPARRTKNDILVIGQRKIQTSKEISEENS